MTLTYLTTLGRHIDLRCLSSIITSLYIVLVRLNDVHIIKDVSVILVLAATVPSAWILWLNGI